MEKLRLRNLWGPSLAVALAIAAIWLIAGTSSVVPALTVALGMAAIVAGTLAFLWMVRSLWRRFFGSRSWAVDLAKAPLAAWFGLIVIGFFLIIAIFAPLIAPYGETQIIGDAYLPPSSQFLLGTDQVGRDLMSRIIFGARNTIGIALITTLLEFALGGSAGLLAATMGRGVDQILSRAVDLLMAIPQLIFALLALSILGTGLINLIIVIAVLDSTRVFRLARGVGLGIVAMDFVESAQLRGESLWYVIRREILPNALAPLIAEFGMRLTFVILTVAALSFLGLGVQPPMADWASMVAENKIMITFGMITPLVPGLCIALLTISINLLVDWKLHQASGLKD